MRIAVTGKSGQVVGALLKLAGQGHEILALGRPELDLLQPELIAPAIRAVAPDVLVSAAAYTLVDKAEEEPDAAFAINRDGARALAEAAAELQIPIIHLSTDYVFDGRKPAPYVEDDPTSPLSVYGHSKLEGELAVAAATHNHAILRTSWVYSAEGKNFVKTMLRLGQTRDELSVVCDQFGCPTSADDIASGVLKVAERLKADDSSELRGTFHMVGTGETTWADFAEFIFSVSAEMTGRAVKVTKIPTSQYPTPATRPANSRLDCTKLKSTHGIQLPHWQASTRNVVTTLSLGDFT